MSPSPLVSRVSLIAFCTMSSQVQPGFGLGHLGLLEQVAVVVDDEARDVLRQADQLAVEAERLQGLRVEVVLLEGVRVVRAGSSIGSSTSRAANWP